MTADQVFAILSGRISSAASGISDVKLENGHLIFTTADGSKIDSGELDIEGGGTFDRTDRPVISVGGISTSTSLNGKTWQEVIETMLYPYQEPTLSISVSPATTEKGRVVSTVNVSGSVGKKSSPIKDVKIYVGSVSTANLVTTITSVAPNGGNYSYQITGRTISTDTTIYAVTEDETGKKIQKSATVGFAGRRYWGIVSADTVLTQDIITGFSGTDLSNSKAKDYSGITGNNIHIVYAYPTSNGALTKILDGNGFGYLDSYTRTTMNIKLTKDATFGEYSENYYVYMLTKPASFSGFSQAYS